MRLVAAGNTSREIGGQLFLSPRTVEMHVRSSMLKLDCRTRAAAVRRITQLGLMEEPAGDPGPLSGQPGRYGDRPAERQPARHSDRAR